MTNGVRPLTGALCMLVLWTGSRVVAAETSGGNPYQAIVDRNVFGLKPPPPPPDPEANKPPPPKIYLQGIWAFQGTKRALLKAQVPPKQGEQPKGEQSFILAEGQRDGDVEVLEIDDKAGIVKVNNSGTIMNLNFEDNGIKTAAAPGPAGQPRPGGPNPAAIPFPSDGTKGIPPIRPIRTSPAGAAVSPASYSTTPSAVTSYGGTRGANAYTSVPAAPAYGGTPAVAVNAGPSGTLTVPGMAATGPGGPRQKNWPPDMALTPEQAAIQEAAYTMKYQKEIANGTMPSIPGSNPLLDNQNPPQQTTTPVNTGPPLPPGAARPFQYRPQ